MQILERKEIQIQQVKGFLERPPTLNVRLQPCCNNHLFSFLEA